MKELAKKSRIDLEKELGLKQLSLRDLRFGTAGSKNKNVKAVATLRKDIARLMTALSNLKFKI